MALFGLNWEESKWPGHFCPEVPTFFASKIGVKLPPGKKVPWHRRWAALSRWSNCHFCQKNAFFGQKKSFFQKVHFIQKLSVTPNTIFECVKNGFLLSNPKLVFFTEFNLHITLQIGFLLFDLCKSGWMCCHWELCSASNAWLRDQIYFHSPEIALVSAFYSSHTSSLLSN